MAESRYFRRVRCRKAAAQPAITPTIENLIKLLTESVVEPFQRVMNMDVIVVPFPEPNSVADDEPPSNPCHPACAQYANTDYCRESWQLHMAEARRVPEAHWHRCDMGMYCAVVPVAYEGHCLAAAKFACGATLDEATFDRHVVFLDILVENFSESRAEFLARLVKTRRASHASNAANADTDQTSVGPSARHPRIEESLEYIQTNLCNAGLTVVGVARHVGVHANHLCQLFSRQVGQRMSRYITDQRIELAKTLLATTNYQIKRIAHDTGHAHPNWFSHLFTVHTGMTPGEYRRKARSECSS